MQEQVLVASRRKIAFHALLSGALLVASIVVVALPARVSSGQIIAYGLSFAFFTGLALITNLAGLARPYRLVIGPDALVVVRSIRWPLRFAWTDVRDIRVRTRTKGHIITIRFDKSGATTGALDGGDASRQRVYALAVGEFPMSPDEIARLLNAAREGEQAAPPAAAQPALAPIVT